MEQTRMLFEQAVVMETQLVLGVDINGFHKPDYQNPEIKVAKEKFDQWLETKTSKPKSTSYIQTVAEIEVIRDVLRGLNFIN